jgi:hypothetical protein
MAKQTRTALGRSLLLVTTIAVATSIALAGAPAGATHDGDVQLGHYNSTNSVTGITNTDANETALDVDAEGDGPGIYVTSDSGEALFASAITGTAVYGSAPTGVWGSSVNGKAVYGVSHGTGVHGATGCCSPDSIGVRAVSAFGKALQVNGTAFFSSSGEVTIPSGASSAAVTSETIGSQSLVLALLQQNRAGVWVRGVVMNKPCAGCFKILLNTAVGKDTTVAYFVLN